MVATIGLHARAVRVDKIHLRGSAIAERIVRFEQDAAILHYIVWKGAAACVNQL
jgi:hypothetical protein